MTIRTTMTAALAISAATLALGFQLPARAQATQGSAGGGAEIELGATQASSVELGAGSASSGGGHPAASSASYSGGGGGASSDTRLALQLRFDAINLVALAEPDDLDSGAQPSRQLLVPMATPGVRLLDDEHHMYLSMKAIRKAFSK